MSDPLSVISSLRASSDDELTPLFQALQDQWTHKLWHQMTETLLQLYKDPLSKPFQISLFERFVTKAEANMSPLAYITLAISASEQFATTDESVEFMENMAEHIKNSETRKIKVFVDLRLVSLYTAQGNIPQAMKLLDTSRKLMDELQISDRVIRAQLYGTSCEFYKRKSDYNAFYRNALLYLACIDRSDLTAESLKQRAYDLCIAALLADKIYNFGELVLHPILKDMGSEFQWLQDLVEAVNHGNVTKFMQLRATFCEKSPMLEAALPFLEQKICLMALCECVFQRQRAESGIPFAVIAKETHLQAGAKVEVLVMKAFSLGLMKGSIDEVSKTVHITWLQPRVLTNEQIKTMGDRLSQWINDVSNLGDFIAQSGSVEAVA
ncbi:proteasome regulatory particle lid subunit [Starmerella bacillaris]|uniref:Proteasome regulatory particle lid subunit n=1 Tax=Starmerella bacillaris TaxID=1247836 RepID=A0AAV5RJ76_STABA|nr:proteasome regulatory particle lid subunit [Starmerella bacillaris]